ncbi:MAG: hypothetical protein N2Z61_02800 [Tepidimonas fonticaldi]|nr:hypothetical protein [Tepidimonas fonticaldi]
MGERQTPFTAYLRHRYRAHVQGWLMLGVAGLTGQGAPAGYGCC